MFRWAALTLCAATVAWFGWMVNDVRAEMKTGTKALNEQLPAILANTKRGTDLVVEKLPTMLATAQKSAKTLEALANDIQNLRNLAGATGGATRDKSLVVYADQALDLIEGSGLVVGLKKKLGGGLKGTVPAGEWVIGARKEAMWLSFRARSRKDLLDRLTKTKFGSRWQMVGTDGQPTPMDRWLGDRHPATKAVLDAEGTP